MFGKLWVAHDFGKPETPYRPWTTRVSVLRKRVTSHETLEFVTESTEEPTSAAVAAKGILGNNKRKIEEMKELI